MTAIQLAGRGAVTALGRGLAPLMDGIFEGRSALAPLRRLKAVAAPTQVAGELSDELVAEAGGERSLPFQMARWAADQALEEAGQPARSDLGLVLASTKADLSGVNRPGAGFGSSGLLLARLAEVLSIGGPRLAVSCACASGLSAIAVARRWLLAGRVQRVLVVGVDALSEFILRGFSGLLALDEQICRPFDRERRGLSLGEGAGALLFSRIPGETLGVVLAGAGESTEAHHLTGPSRDGLGLELAATRALEAAGLPRERIDYVHLHGTGTPYNDAMEGQALSRLFGGSSPPASGTKRQTGHTLGAAGAIEALITAEVLIRQRAPTNLGLTETDVDPGLTLLREPARLERARAALKVCGGFGGINAAVVLVR